MSGLDQISVVVVGYAVVVVVAAVFAALVLGGRPPWLDSLIWFLELLAAVRLVAGVGSLLSGHRASEQTAYVGYLIASVCIIPIALASFRPAPGADAADDEGTAPEEDRGVWSGWVVAVSALAVGVIAVRTAMTL